MKTVLTGITKNLSSGTKEDGQLEEMLNLRHDGALLRPIGVPEEIKLYENYGKETQKEYTLVEGEKIVFVHQFKGREFVISYRSYDQINSLYLLGELIDNNVDVVHTFITECSNPIKIVQLGAYLYIHGKGVDNLLMMQYNTVLKNIKYTKSYTADINIQMYAKEVPFEEKKELYSTGNRRLNYIIGARYPYSGVFNQLLNAYKGRGYLYNTAIVRGAFKAKNGNYILHTAPILINPNNGECFKVEETIPEGSNVAGALGGNLYWDGFLARYTFKGVEIEITIPAISDIKDFKEEIERFDVFIAEIPLETDDFKPFINTSTADTEVKLIGFKENNSTYLFTRMDYSYPFYCTYGLKDKILGVTTEDFKFIKSYSLDEIEKGVTNEKLPLKDFYENKIEYPDGSETPPAFNFDDNDSRDKISGLPFVYNSRLHISSFIQNYFKGYDPRSFATQPQVEESIKRFAIQWEADGLTMINTSSDIPNDFGYMIAFPKRTAERCQISAIVEKGKEYGYATITRDKTEKFLLDNMACILDVEEGQYTFYYQTEDSGVAKYEKIKKIDFNYYWEDSFQEDFIPNVEKTRILRSDVVKVSEVYDPINFIQTLQVGQGEIKELSVIDTALSQGQFGQYPLYAFCSDGVYAFNVGTDGSYSNIAPVSRDVITGDIISIDKAVAFISDRGLKIMQSDKATDVSLVMQSNAYEKIEKRDFIKTSKKISIYTDFPAKINKEEIEIDDCYGYEFDLTPYIGKYDEVYFYGYESRNNDIVRGLILDKDGNVESYVPITKDEGWGWQSLPITENSKTLWATYYEELGEEDPTEEEKEFEPAEVELRGYPPATLEEFINGAKLGYNYFFGEIYLFREEYDFAYVYGLNSQTWSKRSMNFISYVNVYPDLYIQDKEGIYRLSKELLPDARTHRVKLKTRPMCWGDGFKKIARMIIRSLVIGKWTIRILASNDGVNFHELRNVSIDTDTPKRDIPFRRISGSFKFYVLEIDADMDERAYIEFIETELQESIFNKRIR
ncbi:MAG: hypothetical protein IJ341_04005 [Bacteroidales bacterium]|nr:hypothetical protein [Bacteroidales bacterium]